MRLYAAHRFGTLSSNIQALGHFFVERWSKVRDELSDFAQAWIFSDVGLCMERVSRIEECIVPLANALILWKKLNHLKHAAIVAGMLAMNAEELGQFSKRNSTHVTAFDSPKT